MFNLKKIIFSLILVFILLFCFSSNLFSFWVWTPESGKWINPKYAVKDTPEEQFEHAMSFFDNSEYELALKEFEKLVDAYPKSEYAPRSQYFKGRSYEALDKYYEAFRAYQKVIDKYPYIEELDEVIERQVKIGNIFFEGKKGKLWGMPVIASEDRAIEVFKKVVQNSPYKENIDKVYYKLGIAYKKKGDYQKAKEAFNSLIENFPNSKLIDKAEFESANCAFKFSLDPSYDQEATNEAIKEFEQFVEKNPNSKLSKKAKDELDGLNEKRAEKVFGIAEFYEKQDKKNSAVIYYEEVVNKYPDTKWAIKAIKKLTIFKKK